VDRADTDVLAAEHLVALDGASERGGALGFCLGAGLAFWAGPASPLIGATVSYCYVMWRGEPDFTKISGPVLGHATA
jgi:dienelactone hydrolase